NTLICCLIHIGVLDKACMCLDYVLALKIEDFLERRLQTQVLKLDLTKSIPHAWALIREQHIWDFFSRHCIIYYAHRLCRVGKQIVNVPSFVVRLDSQNHIDFALTSPYNGGREGRVKRKRAAAAARKEEGGDDEEDE
ncbi:hypothetical protein ARMGADRAFT_936269, partial [Armillaria gallica]